MTHTAVITVRFYELDPYEHVNHSVYIQYFEAARAQWLTDVGFPLEKLKAEGIQIVVTELSTRYLGSAGPGDELTIESELSTLRRVSMTFQQRILRDGQLLVEQTITAATVTTAGRPTRVPADLAGALGTAG
ncbi:MAG: thioesterase family protein [Acidimicrobiia bacterium]|nr:thioesterase family protein [Acidimicrobiia bacterium]MDX2468119.1 thioesterase family protein [Acidimicrobiia bacterium]